MTLKYVGHTFRIYAEIRPCQQGFLLDAHSQTPLSPDTTSLVKIIIPWGKFKFRFLPFGLQVSCSKFQTGKGSVIQGLSRVLAH